MIMRMMIEELRPQTGSAALQALAVHRMDARNDHAGRKIMTANIRRSAVLLTVSSSGAEGGSRSGIA